MNHGWRWKLKLWAPPLVGIPVMLALGLWIKELGYLFFGHHLFWMIGIFLLINPVSETFWPGPPSGKSTPIPGKVSRSSKVRQQADMRKRRIKQKPAWTSETPGERLARLKKEKEAVDEELGKLSADPKRRIK